VKTATEVRKILEGRGQWDAVAYTKDDSSETSGSDAEYEPPTKRANDQTLSE